MTTKKEKTLGVQITEPIECLIAMSRQSLLTELMEWVKECRDNVMTYPAQMMTGGEIAVRKATLTIVLTYLKSLKEKV